MRNNIFIGLVVLAITACSQPSKPTYIVKTIVAKGFAEPEADPSPEVAQDSVEVINSTFLGGSGRNYYGNYLDTSLHLIWRHKLGKGETILGKGRKTWSGAGWTGQPLIVREKDSTYLIIGCYDHHLKKINAETGRLVWQYKYDDVIKGTGTIVRNDSASNPQNRFVILQGSRRGLNNNLRSKRVFSYRAISYFSGCELWRMNIPQDKGWSRDVDASALCINNTAYIGLENGLFRVFSPFETFNDEDRDTIWTAPRVLKEHKLYHPDDRKKHGGNLVTESSPAQLDDRVYIASGSGHLYGYNLLTDSIDFDFYIGSDIDGSPVVTSDSCLLITIEKQYIKGHGGVFKIDPRRPDTNCVVWFFPTGDKNYADWKGGIIGSAAVNDRYSNGITLAAVSGIDGYLYVLDHQTLGDSNSLGPNQKHHYPTPKVVFKKYIGSSISTPVFTSSNLIAAGYKGLNLFTYTESGQITDVKTIKGVFEATPSIHNGRVYIASRNGYLYCFGEKASDTELPIQQIATEITTNQLFDTISESHNHYHLIVGTYDSKWKAQRFADKLTDLGFRPYLINQNRRFYLSVESSSSKSLLAQHIEYVTTKTETGAWVMKADD